MSTEIAILTEEYLEQCIDIAKAKAKISGIRTEFTQKTQEFITGCLTPNDKSCSIGYIEDGALHSWISLGFAEGPKDGKVWAITALYTRDIGNYFSFNNLKIGLLTKKAFEIAEGNKYYTYYYSISNRLERVYETQWKKNKLGFHGRYDMSLVAVIPPNTKPESEIYWRLMGQELRPESIAIKCRVLKPEFREQ